MFYLAQFVGRGALQKFNRFCRIAAPKGELRANLRNVDGLRDGILRESDCKVVSKGLRSSSVSGHCQSNRRSNLHALATRFRQCRFGLPARFRKRSKKSFAQASRRKVRSRSFLFSSVSSGIGGALRELTRLPGVPKIGGGICLRCQQGILESRLAHSRAHQLRHARLVALEKS